MVFKEESGVAKLVLTDRESKDYPRPIDLPMSTLFSIDRKFDRIVKSRKLKLTPFEAQKALQENYTQIPEHDLLRKLLTEYYRCQQLTPDHFLSQLEIVLL